MRIAGEIEMQAEIELEMEIEIETTLFVVEWYTTLEIVTLYFYFDYYF